ncbi:glycoside hydrolase family 10 protein [Dendrothele bispora CBS 962.96]|uniref:Beta-xylanase n=1 Tax=Dendrothele bispora (strain CBS 962.96) TaxID=1314807 RepID=A0A4S8LEB2_DENBC|nr:glycoside hydrolase family 10 protein [Dendrothele bispora CBS 962.96]
MYKLSISPVFLLALISAVPGSLAQTTTAASAEPTATSNAKLHTVAKAAGKLYFGSATDNPELTNVQYISILNDSATFGQITPANSLKWDATEPARGDFNFSGGDQIVNLARANGQLLRGHNCVWHSQLPDWVSDGNFDAATLTSILQTHCSTVVGRYQGEIWDVVNEPFNDDGTMRSFVFTDTLGSSYIDIALQAAKAADPNTKLYINDFNIEGPGVKSTAMQNLVKDLKSRGIPIDGVGIQAHLIVGELPADIQQNIEAFTALGVEVAITELDIRMDLPATPDKLAQQKTDYQTVVSACNNVSECIGVTIWDFSDLVSWIPGTFPGQGAACPWDENFVKKPAYDGIVIGFQ